MKIIFILCLMFQFYSSKAAIYGADDRKEIRDVKDLIEVAKAVAVQVGDVFLEENDSSSYKIPGLKPLNKSGVCPSERFSEQVSMGMCTGFLVAPNILITAGHCNSNVGIDNMGNEYCKSFSWIFDYNLKNSSAFNYMNVPKRNVYKCVRALRTENMDNFPFDPLKVGTTTDFSVLELDRNVEGIKPLDLAKNRVSQGDYVYTIGHPWGLPAKYSGESQVISSMKTIFSVALDTWGGNSGGPVFNSANELVGILTAGHQFDSYGSVGGCQKFNHCDEQGENCDIDSELFKLNEVQWIDFTYQYWNPVVVPLI